MLLFLAVDPRTRILERLQARVEELARLTTECILAEVGGFGPIRDAELGGELMALAQPGIALLVNVLSRALPPTPHELDFIRERARHRARQLVPLSALLHAYLIANRVVGQAIAGEAGSGVASLSAALGLTAMASEYTLVTITAMADAYLETVQGDLADLERRRCELLETLLVGRLGAGAVLARTAAGLGLDPGRTHVAVVATVRTFAGDGDQGPLLRWAADAIARAAGQPDRQAFVVTRGAEVVALLRQRSQASTADVLERAAGVLRDSRQAQLTAGVGPAFTELAELRGSHDEARRALRHASASRPIVSGPEELRLFDELTLSAERTVAALIPERTREVLEDPILRASLEAFSAANLNVAVAAHGLFIHPNTLRYRLRRIAERTGCDPHVFTDLLELMTAARILTAAELDSA